MLYFTEFVCKFLISCTRFSFLFMNWHFQDRHELISSIMISHWKTLWWIEAIVMAFSPCYNTTALISFFLFSPQLKFPLLSNNPLCIGVLWTLMVVGSFTSVFQFFLELMKVPRVESKLRVFLFKIQFNSQVCLIYMNFWKLLWCKLSKFAFCLRFLISKKAWTL